MTCTTLRALRIWTLGLLAVFNAWDAVSTVYVLDRRIAIELNPIAWQLYLWGSEWFYLFKGITTTIVIVILASNWTKRSARNGAYTVTVLYGILFLYQVISLMVYWVS